MIADIESMGEMLSSLPAIQSRTGTTDTVLVDVVCLCEIEHVPRSLVSVGLTNGTPYP